MKKLFLAAAVLGVVSLSSCKSEKEKVDAKVENTQENVQDRGGMACFIFVLVHYIKIRICT